MYLVAVKPTEYGYPEGSNDFETWLLNPSDFNYEKFETNWLIEIKEYIILDKIKGITQIGSAIDKELKKGFNPDLAEIKYKYFNNN